jgi:polar amino acid transport system substrate-binding protein
MRKFAVTTALVAIFALGTAAAGVASVIDKDVIIAGTEGTYPPFEFYDESNALTGFDVELLRAIEPIIGKKIQIVDMAFDGLIPALLTGKIDVIAAAINSTTERRQTIDFSDVYVAPDGAFVAKSDNVDIRSLEDLNGKTVGVQLGTTEDLFLSDLTGVSIQVKRYQRTDDAVRDVLLGRVDAALLDAPVSVSYTESERFRDFLKVAFKETINPPEEGCALGVKKGDPQFLDALNSALRQLESSGELQAIKEKYGLD